MTFVTQDCLASANITAKLDKSIKVAEGRFSVFAEGLRVALAVAIVRWLCGTSKDFAYRICFVGASPRCIDRYRASQPLEVPTTHPLDRCWKCTGCH
jgi:hypothetical protein